LFYAGAESGGPVSLRSGLLELIPDVARVSSGESILEAHSRDLTYHSAHAPEVVVFPCSTEEVSLVLAHANERGVAVVAFGAGTSLEGHTIPVRGGIVLDLSRLDAILAVRPEDLQATVQAGVTRSALNAAAGEHGLQFPVDPGADATLGGMAATNASGTTTVRYGGMRTQVLALEVVLADGTVIRPGSRAVKSSAGYDLRGIFVGSEGTLGVITELTLRLYGIAEHTVAVRAAFADVGAACRAAVAMIGSGVMVTRVELLDSASIAAVNAYKETAYTEAPSLFIEFAGTESGVAGDLHATRELAELEGCVSFEAETAQEARTRLWEARHHVAFAIAARSPGKSAMATDVAVPLSELPAAVEFARERADARARDAAIIGHVGDGNFHVALMVDPADPADLEDALALNAELVDWALARGGTCTGEHGIGLGKLAYLQREHGDLIPYFQAVKDTFDPKGILNPGKVLAASGT
jgi:D-lactate dehydrogenase (cytochrome)